MSFALDDYFAYFIDQFGVPENRVLPSEETLKNYQGRLPDRLLEYWKEYGFCSFMSGLIWIVNPDAYKNDLDAWLAFGDIRAEDSYHVIARNGFGDLYLWGEKTGPKYTIEAKNGRVFIGNDKSKKIASGESDKTLSSFFALFEHDTVDLDDVDTDKPMFAQAVKKFGPLKEDEVFAFEPALFAGGEQTIGHINKVNIHVHLDILLQMVGQPQVMDIHGLARIAFGH